LQVHNVFNDETFIYIILQYAPGGSIRDLLQENGALSEKLAAQFISELSMALYHCHKHGVAHRDIKPDYFVLRFDGRSMMIGTFLQKVCTGLYVLCYWAMDSLPGPYCITVTAPKLKKSS